VNALPLPLAGSSLLPVMAVQNIQALQALADPSASWENAAALAAHLGKDKSNFHKTLHRMCEEQLLTWPDGAPVPSLLPAGEAALAAWARAHGAEASTADALTDSAERDIPFDLIDPWPDQPRQHKDPQVVEDMAVSIGDKGVLQAITVRPSPTTPGRYQVVIGETRRAAAALAVERGDQPADFRIPAKVRDLDDAEAFELAVVENVQREDLHWMDEARALLTLHQRGQSAAQLARLFGNRGKRSIQDYTKIARELDPAVAARAYLPATDKDHLSYVKARDLVGEKKAPPAIALSPRLAMTLLELVDAASLAIAKFPASGLLTARLYSAPSGGPLAALNSHPDNLIGFGFDNDGRDMVVRIPVTEKLHAWLDQVGFLEHRADAVRKLREAALGELEANAHPADLWVTPELNLPAAPAAPAAQALEPDPLSPSQRRVLREIAARSLHRHRLLDDWVQAHAQALDDPDYQALYDLELTTHQPDSSDGVHGATLRIALTLKGRDHLKTRGQAPQDGLSRNSCATPWLREAAPITTPEDGQLRDAIAHEGAAIAAAMSQPIEPDEETPEYLRRLAGPGSPAATAQPQPEPEDALPPILALVLAELAHKISAEGVERGRGTWAVPVMAGWHEDKRNTQLVQSRRLAFMPIGERTLATITKRGMDWLLSNVRLLEVGGKPNMTAAALDDAQKRFAGGLPNSGARYHTLWLNPPATLSPPADDATDAGARLPEGQSRPCPSPASDLTEPAPPPPAGEGDREAVEGASPEAPTLTSQARALLACYGELGQLDQLLARLRDKATAAHQGEIDQHRRLIEAIRETAKANLPEGIV
jgi:ParB family chromosome partitioning protein